MTNLDRCYNIFDLRDAAKRRLPKGIFEYVDKGTEDQLSLEENRAAFQRWYADPEIARLLRHDLRPLTYVQSLVYFDTVIIPSSARGLTCAIHDRATDELIGTTGLTEVDVHGDGTCYFRILIGDSRFWNRGYGTEATRLILDYAFNVLSLHNVMLRVFSYNERAIRAYRRVGFREIGRRRQAQRIGMQVYDVVLMDCLATEFGASTLRPLLPPAADADA